MKFPFAAKSRESILYSNELSKLIFRKSFGPIGFKFSFLLDFS